MNIIALRDYILPLPNVEELRLRVALQQAAKEAHIADAPMLE